MQDGFLDEDTQVMTEGRICKEMDVMRHQLFLFYNPLDCAHLKMTRDLIKPVGKATCDGINRSNESCLFGLVDGIPPSIAHIFSLNPAGLHSSDKLQPARWPAGKKAAQLDSQF